MENLLTEAIAAQLRETADNLRTMSQDGALHAAMAEVASACITALRNGNKILFAGNGGSAADAQHLAGELVSRFNYDRPGLPAFSLSTDTSVLTAIGNDYGYERLFARQIEAVGNAGDVFFGISTSGRSPNILNALRTARDKGLVTVGLTGRLGGDMPGLCDHCLRTPSDLTPRIQEGHISIGHTICYLIEQQLFPLPQSSTSSGVAPQPNPLPQAGEG
jgi:D-sedoheptulose 7-phosphate isomerase